MGVVTSRSARAAAYARLQQAQDVDGAVNELLGLVASGEFADLESMDDAELRELADVAVKAANRLSWFKERKDDYEECHSLHWRARNILRDRKLAREDYTRKQRDRMYAIMDSAKALTKLADAVSIGYDRKIMETQFNHFKLAPEAARQMSEFELRGIVSDGETGGLRGQLRVIDACIESLEEASAWSVAATALEDVRSYRAALSAKIEALATNAKVARSELARRQAEQAENERMSESMPELVKQLQQRVAELEASKAVSKGKVVENG